MVFFHITVLNNFQELLVLGSPSVNLVHPGYYMQILIQAISRIGQEGGRNKGGKE